MQLAQIPAKFPIPFANAAGNDFIRPIPLASQIGSNPGFASLTDGFVPLNFTPIASGGIPPFGSDMNGVLNQATAWNRWQAAGGAVFFDSQFASDSGGYPKYSVLMSAIVPGNYWMSTADNNQNDPDAGGANWVAAPGTVSTGACTFRLGADTVPGWVILNGTTIGNGASAANQRANSDCQFAFVYFWGRYPNTQCPVSGGRGVSAISDFNAGKTITVLDLRSTSIMGVDGMGNPAGGNGLLAGVPVITGGVTTVSSLLGENLHTLILAEITAHTHPNFLTDNQHQHTVPPQTFRGTSTSGSATAIYAFGQGTDGSVAIGPTGFSVANISLTNASQGSGGAHNNTERSALVFFFFKL